MSGRTAGVLDVGGRPGAENGGAVNRAVVRSMLADRLPGTGAVAAVTAEVPSKRRPPRGYLGVIRTIDRFTEASGYLFIIVIIPLVLANVVEVFARYVLRAPTSWALDVTTMSYAALFMLGIYAQRGIAWWAIGAAVTAASLIERPAIEAVRVERPRRLNVPKKCAHPSPSLSGHR